MPGVPQSGNNFSPKLKGINFLINKKVPCGPSHSVFSKPVWHLQSLLFLLSPSGGTHLVR